MDEKTKPFGVPFACLAEAREMMRILCRPGMKFCDCCPMANVMKAEARGEQAQNSGQTQERV